MEGRIPIRPTRGFVYCFLQTSEKAEKSEKAEDFHNEI